MGLRSQKGAENPTTKCYGEAFVGILVFLKGIIPHIIELKQSKCRVGYGELLLWPARKPKGVGARGMGKVAFSYTLWLPLPRKRGILSEENVSPVTGSGLDAQIQVWASGQAGHNRRLHDKRQSPRGCRGAACRGLCLSNIANVWFDHSQLPLTLRGV